MNIAAENKLREEDAAAREMAQREFLRPLALEAGAGTGKTSALVARIVAWSMGQGWERAAKHVGRRRGQDVAERPDPRRIAARVLGRVVAITFTEAAAAEMATRAGDAFRIIAAGKTDLPDGLLAGCLPADPAERAARARWLLGALDHLVVRTIHAYCRRLLAAYPLEAGLHPGFEVDADERMAADAIQQVLEDTLKEAYGEPGDPLFLDLAEAGKGPGELAAALAVLIEKGVSPASLDEDPFSPPLIAREVGALRDALKNFLTVEGGLLRNVNRRATVTLETRESLEAAGALLDQQEATDLHEFARLLDALRELWPGKRRKRLAAWGGSDFNVSETKCLGEKAGEVGLRARAVSEVLERLLQLNPVDFDRARRALGPLLGKVHATLRRRGGVTYEALLRDARNLLAGHPDVLAGVRSGIDQLLVDEFQDTDAAQCEIVSLIGLGGDARARPGLFVVGDPKQSIYGWRGADLRAYDEFLDALTGEGGLTRILYVNFRSRAPLLEEVEKVIRPVMERREGLQPDFQPLLAHREGDGFRKGDLAPLQYWASQDWDEEKSAAAYSTKTGRAAAMEARALALELRALNEIHGVAWEKIGVLFRTRGDLETYLRELRRADVPYAVEGDRTYYRKREVIEAAALVRCALDPNDHLALLTFLRSASVGVPDAAIVPLWMREFPRLMTALDRPDREQLEAIAAVVTDVTTALPPDIPGLDRIRGWEKGLLAAVQALARVRESFREEAADVFVERLRTLFLLEATEAGRFLGNYRIANLDRFFRGLLENLEDDADPQAALRALRRAVREEEKQDEGRPAGAAASAVRVMTIHQAKGLGFEHVYVMQLHKRRGGGREDAATDAEMIDGRLELKLLGAPTPGFGRVGEWREAVEQAETVRTLYVAMTRAKERLVLAGTWFSRTPAIAASSHMHLLAGRLSKDSDLASVMGDLGSGNAAPFRDLEGARFVFPGLLPEEKEETGDGRGAAPTLPSATAVRAGWRALGERRAQAASRMARPVSAPASADAHEALEQLSHEQPAWGGDEEEGFPGRAGGVRRDRAKQAAMAAGAAVHKVLELIDLRGDPADELARWRERLPGILERQGGGSAGDEILERVRELLDRFREGPLLERLRTIAPNVLGREVPILLAPAAEGEAIGFVSGVVDLLYRDPESNEIVVADYKTDSGLDEPARKARAEAYRSQGEIYVRGVSEALGISARPRFELWFVDPGEVLTVPPAPSRSS